MISVDEILLYFPTHRLILGSDKHLPRAMMYISVYLNI